MPLVPLTELEQKQLLERSTDQKVAEFQKQKELCEIVLRNVLDRVLDATPGMSLESEQKNNIVSVTANLLINNRCPMPDAKNSNDPDYLNNLAVLLVRTLAVDNVLSKDPDFQKIQTEQMNEIMSLGKTLLEKDALQRFISPSNEEKSDLKSLPDEIKHLEKDLENILKKTDEKVDKLLAEKEPAINKAVDQQLKSDELKDLPQFKPDETKDDPLQPTKNSNTRYVAGEDPYVNIAGLVGNIPKYVTSVANNDLNPNGLLESMRMPTDAANIDNPTLGHKLVGTRTGYHFNQNDANKVSQNTKAILDAPSQESFNDQQAASPYALPNPFNKEYKPK